MITHRAGYTFGDAGSWWFLFVGAGLFALASPFLYDLQVPESRAFLSGFVVIFAGIVLKTHFFGTQIDLRRRQIRNFRASFLIKMGSWSPIPNTCRLVLSSSNVSFWTTPNGISPSFKQTGRTYSMGLFFESSSQPDYFLQTHSQKTAIDLSSRISQKLNIPMEGSFEN